MLLADAELPVQRNSALIVDDDAIDRRRLKSFCTKAGLNLDFVEASSLAEMHVEMNRHLFDLIFIDYRLQDGDGLKALEAIKVHPMNAMSAKIMVAGIAQTEIAVQAMKQGCNDYILKDSFDPNWLRRAVTNALENSKLQRDVDSAQRMRASVVKTMNGFAQDCAQEMKPTLSKMLRQIAMLRSETGRIRKAEFDALEQSCTRLRDFIEGIESYVEQHN